MRWRIGNCASRLTYICYSFPKLNFKFTQSLVEPSIILNNQPTYQCHVYILCTISANCDFDKGTFCNWAHSVKSSFAWSLGSGKTKSGKESGGMTGPTTDASGKGISWQFLLKRMTH